MNLNESITSVLNEVQVRIGKPPKDTYKTVLSRGYDNNLKIGDPWIDAEGKPIANTMYLGEADFAVKRSGGYIEIVHNDIDGSQSNTMLSTQQLKALARL